MKYAAVLYDFVSIQTKGIVAKTNFSYTRQELFALMALDSLLMVRH